MRPIKTLSMTALAILVAGGVASCDCEGEPGGSNDQSPLLATDAGGGPCPNPLMPLVEGASWTYEVSSSPSQSPTIAELRVIELTAKGRATIVKVRKKQGAREVVVQALCNSEGVSFLPMFVDLGPPLPVSFNYAPRVTKQKGVLVPLISKLRSGADWNHSLEAHTERPGGKALTMDSQWQVSASYLGERVVTVPAGRYLAKQIKLAVSGHHRPPAEKEVVLTERMSDPPPLAFTYSLAPGIGVVKIEAEALPDRPQIRPLWELTKVQRLEQE